MRQDQTTNAEARHALGMWDAISIIIGIVVGAGIYETAPLVFQNVSHPEIGILAWLTGGILSLVGALCYAELATTYPRIGGDYVYLTRAYGPLMGFLFGWAQLAVILTGSIGMMAFVFADYASALWILSSDGKALTAVSVIVALTLTNALGVGSSKMVQNTLTILNVLSLVTIIGAGILVADVKAPAVSPTPTVPPWASRPLASP